MSLKIKPLALTTSNQTIYSVDAGVESSVHGLIFSNTSDNTITFNLYIYQASTNTTYTLADSYQVPARKNYAWPRPINMNSGDYIEASVSANTAMFASASIYENTSSIAKGFTPIGAWSSGATYSQNDVVTYSGYSYIAIQAGTNKNPSTQTSYWMKIVDSTLLDFTANSFTASYLTGQILTASQP